MAGFGDVKDAIYQAVKAGLPRLVMYPAHVDYQNERFPNLSFIELSHDNLQAKPFWETTVGPTQAVGAPLEAVPVVARVRSTVTLILRDTVGKAVKDVRQYQAMRDLRTKMELFFAKTQALTVGKPPFETVAELWFEGFRDAGYDAKSGIFQHEYTLRIDPWRLVDEVPVSVWRADQIQLDVTTTKAPIPPPPAASAISVTITRNYPLN